MSGLGVGAWRIDHIGSTAIPGMAAKDVLDIQVSVDDLDGAAVAFSGLLRTLGFEMRPYEHDHVPAGCADDQSLWVWLWQSPTGGDVNLHVRLVGSPNERLVLLFRDWGFDRIRTWCPCTEPSSGRLPARYPTPGCTAT